MLKRQSVHIATISLALFLLTIVFVVSCGKLEGEVDQNQPPEVSFTTIPVDQDTFNFAPIIYWKGNDPDGFVEYYSYADITDSAAIENPQEYISRIPEDAWTDTIATQARIFLLTESGDTTEHIFYIRSFDNEGAMSEVQYRTFFRSNNPPTIPRMGRPGWDDEQYDTTVYVQDTLFSKDEIDNIWNGIEFAWRGSDPDDRALYQIPLEFQTILVKSPGDTIFVGQWDDEQRITLSGLRTGFYTLYVWARDDGLTLSQAPGRVEFNIIKPTFENDILIYLESPSFQQQPTSYLPTEDSLVTFYESLMEDIKDEIEYADLELDGDDVRIMFTRHTSDSDSLLAPSRTLMHQYKLVIIASDELKVSGAAGQAQAQYKARRNRALLEYLQVGGRLWYQGRMLVPNILWPKRSSFQQTQVDQQLREEFFGVDSIYGPTTWLAGASGFYSEFIGTTPGLSEFDSLYFDETDTTENAFLGYQEGSYGMSGALAIARRPTVVTTQYFLSVTDTLTGRVEDEDCQVVNQVEIAGEEIQYDPGPTRCFLQAEKNNIYPDGVTRVINTTLRDEGAENWEAEVLQVNDNVIFISYLEGEPWRDSDILEVDYDYDPISIYHLTPCEIRKESVFTEDFTTQEIRYRTALSTFSYYFMEYDGTRTAWINNLNWFLNPGINR